MAKRQKQAVDVCWNTITGKVVLTVGSCRVALSVKQAERLAEHIMAGAEALESAKDADDDFDSDLDQRLRDQLNSEVSAAMDSLGPTEFQAKHREPAACSGPAAPPSSSVPLGGTARLAEELGSARETLAEILGGSPHEGTPDAPWTRMTPAFPGVVKADGGGSPPPDAFVPRAMRLTPLERLMSGLAANPGEPGKIWINSQLVCLGDAIKYRAALGQVIDKQRDTTFGATLMASVATPEPPAEIPTLRAD